jgi:hypothetical protein
LTQLDTKTVQSFAAALTELKAMAPYKDERLKMAFAEKALFNILMKKGSTKSSKSVKDLMEVAAIGVANDVRRAKAAEMVEDDPNKSRTVVNLSPSGQKGIKPLADPSIYQTKDQCISVIIGENPSMNSTDASNYCDEIFGNRQKQALQKSAEDGKAQWYSDCLQQNTKENCDNMMAQIYPSNLAARKQASTEVPYHVIAAGADISHIKNTNNLRSAAEIPAHWTGETISELFARKAEEKQRQHEVKNRLLSAKKQSEIPSWAIVSGGLDD